MFKNDMFGCQPALANKRTARNPYRHTHGYKDSCPEMVKFFDACKATYLKI